MRVPAGVKRCTPLAPVGVTQYAQACLYSVHDKMPTGNFSWAAEQLQDFDPAHQKIIAENYRRTVLDSERRACRGAARSVVADANERLRNYKADYQRHDLCLTASDEEIKAFCDARVTECTRIISGSREAGRMLRLLCAVFGRYQLEWPYSLVQSPFGAGGSDDAIRPFLLRCQCVRWWRRQVRKLQAREVEKVARLRRKVAKGRQVYLSDWNVKRFAAAQKRNQRVLEGVEAVNDDGQVYTLAELQALGTSNPGNRRNELMTRMRGFEECADLFGHAGEFWTFTTPSRFHAMTATKSGVIQNSKWVDADPRDGQRWLSLMWSRIRAQLGREGIQVYGFRVAEPHHDGTPHWHLLLFMLPGDVRRARRICRRHLLSDCGTERGAWRRRFTAKAIQSSKGSATGYIAKYISKNINAAHMGDLASDEAPELSLADGAQRVNAWASTWGIRQFQQVGGPSVTVWRELRRLAAEGPDGSQQHLFDELDEETLEAADVGDWMSYTLAMGGPLIPRDDLPMRPAYWVAMDECVDMDTGELVEEPERFNAYGEKPAGSVFGIWVKGFPILTRFYRWAMRLADQFSECVLPAAPPPALDLCQ